jgi:hypothetical protein
MRHGGLVAGRGRLALDHRLGLGDLDGHLLRQLDGDDDAVMDLQEDADAVLQEHLVVADHIGRNHDLLIAFRLHEVEAFAILIEESRIRVRRHGRARPARWSSSARTPCCRPRCGADRPGRRRALAGVEVGRRQDDMKPAVDLDDIAFAKAGGDDFQGGFLACFSNSGPAIQRAGKDGVP